MHLQYANVRIWDFIRFTFRNFILYIMRFCVL